jgi:hypothetical protein
MLQVRAVFGSSDYEHCRRRETTVLWRVSVDSFLYSRVVAKMQSEISVPLHISPVYILLPWLVVQLALYGYKTYFTPFNFILLFEWRVNLKVQKLYYLLLICYYDKNVHFYIQLCFVQCYLTYGSSFNTVQLKFDP